MKSLICDIRLGGSTSQFLTCGQRNLPKTEFINSIKKALSYRARTIPTKIARRFGCLIGVIYSELGGMSTY